MKDFWRCVVNLYQSLFGLNKVFGRSSRWLVEERGYWTSEFKLMAMDLRLLYGHETKVSPKLGERKEPSGRRRKVDV